MHFLRPASSPRQALLAIVMVGGLITSTLFTLLALPTFYQLIHQLQERWRGRRIAREEAA